MNWPFLEKSGPKKWVVEATLALKQNFLAGTLILTCNIYTVPFMSTVSQEGWKAKVLIIETVTCTVYFTIPVRKNWGKGRDPLPLPFRYPSLLSTLLVIYIYSYFEKHCWKKCTQQPWKVFWVVLSSWFFKKSLKGWHERPWVYVCEC